MGYPLIFLKLSPLPVGSVASNTGPSEFYFGASFNDAGSLACSVIPGYLHIFVCAAGPGARLVFVSQTAHAE